MAEILSGSEQVVTAVDAVDWVNFIHQDDNVYCGGFDHDTP